MRNTTDRDPAPRGRWSGAVACLVLAGLLLSAAGALALAGTGVKAGSYTGTNSENAPVTLKITHHGKVISSFLTTLGYNGKCGQGGGPDYTAKTSRIAVKAHGKFSKKITLKFVAAKVFKAPGRISGTARGTTVHGTVLQYLHGKPNKCYTETFTATKG